MNFLHEECSYSSKAVNTNQLNAVHKAASAAVPDTQTVVNGNADDVTRCQTDGHDSC